ncbi:MAG: DUF962 domain-containing protein [Acidobacteria bacterium]|nr:DUF962 domain-containing protein [Acidobacteriota bacterium]
MGKISESMGKYEHEHHNGWNRAMHAIGIPLIFVSLALLVMMQWKWGGIAFVGGWAMLFIGHRIEGNNPAFFQGPIYFLVGPLWVLKELKEVFTGKPKSVEAPR